MADYLAVGNHARCRIFTEWESIASSPRSSAEERERAERALRSLRNADVWTSLFPEGMPAQEDDR